MPNVSRQRSQSGLGEPELGVDERTVVLRAIDGDIRAFEQLVDSYQHPLGGLCRRMLSDAQEAEDVVQETFLSAWKKMGGLTDPDSFSLWIYPLASNACVDVIRRRKARPNFPTETDSMSGFPAESPDPQKCSETRAALHDFERVLGRLPFDQKIVWVLFEMQGKSYGQIAEILEISEGSVRGRIHRARQSIVRGMERRL